MVNALATEEIKYPVYVISKGRWDTAHTANSLIKDKIDFRLVIEPQEFEQYKNYFDESILLTLPFSNLGLGSIPARNWVWDHAKNRNSKKHWIIDDNISGCVKQQRGRRTKCNWREGLVTVESFVDRYQNVAISGMNYRFFAGIPKQPPFYLNTRVYSCILIRNELDFRWRGRYNEDTDLCLQALTKNHCTVLVNAFLVNKKATMTCKGGNMEELYKGRGRLFMSRSLEHQWMHIPGLVKTTRKWDRPQHSVNWKIFKTPLKRIE